MKINFQTINHILKTKNNNVQKMNRHTINGVQSPFVLMNHDSVEISCDSDYCSVSNFELKNIKNLRCPACGLIMLSGEQIEEFIEDVADKRGIELANTLEKYEDERVFTHMESPKVANGGVYRPIKRQVVEVIKDLALQNPSLDLLEIVKLQAKNSINDLIKRQMVVVKELREYIENNFNEGQEKRTLLDQLDEYIRQINGNSKQKFARKNFIYGMESYVLDEDKKAKAVEIAEKMPTSETDVDSFFVKYAQKESSRDVAQRLVYQSIPTTEHLIPRSKGGPSSLSNFICDCADCNSRRGNVEFYDWLKTLPGFEDRLQDYLEDVQEAVDSGKLDSRYDTYIEKIIETLSKLSDGEVELVMPEAKNPEKIKVIMERRKIQIANFREGLATLEERMNVLQREIEKIKKYDDFYEYNAHRELKDKLADIAHQMESISNDLPELKARQAKLDIGIKRLTDEVSNMHDTDKKAMLQKQLESKKQEHDNITEQIVKKEHHLSSLESERNRLRKQRKGYFKRENEIQGEIAKYKEIVDSIEEKEEKIASLREETKAKSELESQLARINETIKLLEEDNSRIVSQRGRNIDRKIYARYMHKIDLDNTATRMLDKKIYKKTGQEAGLTRELIEIAQSAVRSEISRLKKDDNAKYHLNHNQLRILADKKAKIEAKLENLRIKLDEIEQLKKESESLKNGASLKELRKLLDVLIEQKHRIDEIYRLPQMEKRLENIQRAHKRNNKQLVLLTNYQSLSNARYNAIVDLIDIDEALQL